METTTICLPAIGESVNTDDLFMVTNEKHPAFGNIYRCAGLGSENLVQSADAAGSFHFLNITKVVPFRCTYNVKRGDYVCSYYAIRYALGAIKNLLYGKIEADSDESNWHVQIGRNELVEVPKTFTFKIIKRLSLKHYDHGVRGIIASGIPERWA